MAEQDKLKQLLYELQSSLLLETKINAWNMST